MGDDGACLLPDATNIEGVWCIGEIGQGGELYDQVGVFLCDILVVLESAAVEASTDVDHGE